MTWFEPEDTQWTMVSRRLITVRLISVAINVVIILAIVSLISALTGNWLVLGIGVGPTLLFGAWLAWIVVRQVTAHGWAEREDDLLVKRGRFFRKLTVVPYGRMQYVEVQAGPIMRALGIAHVQLHTASPGTDASIAGVPADEAARLRDRLTTRGEAQLAGL